TKRTRKMGCLLGAPLLALDTREQRGTFSSSENQKVRARCFPYPQAARIDGSQSRILPARQTRSDGRQGDDPPEVHRTRLPWGSVPNLSTPPRYRTGPAILSGASPSRNWFGCTEIRAGGPLSAG